MPVDVSSTVCPAVTSPTFSTCFGYQSAGERWIVNGIDFSSIGIDGVEFWFEPSAVDLDEYDEGNLEADEHSFKFTNVDMNVVVKIWKTDGSLATRSDNAVVYDQAHAFADTITSHYDEIANVPGFEALKKLERLAKIVAVVRWLRDNYIPVDLAFLADYVPKSVVTPTKVNLLQLCDGGGSVDANNSGDYVYGESCGNKIVGGVQYILENNPSTILNADPLIAAATASANRVENAQTVDDMEWRFSYGGVNYQGISQTVAASEKDGNVARSSVDLAFPNLSGQPLAFTRYYDSFSGIESGFGPGWSELPFSLSFPESFSVICPDGQTQCSVGEPNVVIDPTKVVLTDRLSGKAVPFVYGGVMSWPDNPPGYQYRAFYVSPRSNDWIFDTPAGYFIYEQRNATNQVTKQVWFEPRVDANGLKVFADPRYVGVFGSGPDDDNDGVPDGVWLEYIYNAQNRLSEIEGVAGSPRIKIDYLGNRISRVWYAAADGTRDVDYSYNNSRLETTDRSGHVIKYTYDDLNDNSSGVVARIDDVTRNEILSNVQPDLENRSTETTTEGNSALTVSHDYDRITGLTTHTDSLGREVEVQRDPLNNRLQSVSKTALVDNVSATLGTSRLYEDVNPLAGPTTVTDARNNSTKYTYDADGNVTSITDALNRTTTIQRGIDISDNPSDGLSVTVVTDPKGRASLRKYDMGGRLVESHRRVNVTSDEVNADGVIEFVIDYSPDVGGYSQVISYDPVTGGVDSITNTVNESIQHSNRNSFGLAETITSAAGYATNVNYDSLARVRTVKGPADIAATITSYEETGLAQDSVSSVTTPVGAITQNLDVVNRQRSVTDARGITTTYFYNRKSQLERVVEISPDASTILTTQYFYDVFGKLDYKLLPNGAKVEYDYDGFDRLTAMREIEVAAGLSGNTAPTLISVPPASNIIDINTGGAFDLNASDADGDSLVYQLVSGPEGLNVDSVTGMMTWAPDATQIGEFTVTVQVVDGNGGVSDLTFTVTVQGVLNEDNNWIKTIGGSGNESATDVTIDSIGNRTVVGRFEGIVDFDGSGPDLPKSPNGRDDVFVTQYDSQGHYQWTKTFGGSDNDFATGVTVDNQGNITVVGIFTGTVDFDGEGSAPPITSNGYDDVFVTQYDRHGDYQWTKTFGGSSSEWAKDVTVDSQGNITVVGQFRSTVDFDGEGSAPPVTATNGFYNNKAYITRYDSQGHYQWTKTFGGNNSGSPATEVMVDSQDNLTVVGYFTGTVDFDGDGADFPRISNGHRDVFMIRYNSQGAYQWVKTFGGISVDMPSSVIVDGQDNLILVGQYYEAFDIDGDGVDDLPKTTSTYGSGDVFITQYDSNGHYQWAKAFGGSDADNATGVTVDNQDNITVVGGFRGTVDFDGEGVDHLRTTNGYDDVFITQYDSLGHYQWTKTFGGVSVDIPSSVIVDGLDNITVVGQFNSTVDFDGGGSAPPITSNGNSDAFITNIAQDTDGDGLPDSWEQANELNYLNAADALFDSDGDGFTNIQEYQNGTNPTILDALIANDDVYSININSSANALPVLSNDHAVQLTPLSITSVGATSAGGSVVVNAAADGLFYTPSENYVGSEIFSYTVNDGVSSKVATVIIAVGIPVPNANDEPTANEPPGANESLIANEPPTANAGPDIIVNEGRKAYLNGSGEDSDGNVVGYTWRQVNPPFVTIRGAATASATVLTPTVTVVTRLTFELVVTDNGGAISLADEVTVIVNPVNEKPTVSVSADQFVDEGTVVSLTGSGSDTDGTIDRFVWRQVEGIIVDMTGANTPTMNFTAPNVSDVTNLVFELTVVDNEGGASPAGRVVVTVNSIGVNPDDDEGTAVHEVVWTELVGATADENTLVAAERGWENSSAASEQVIGVDGAVEFIATEKYTEQIFGLTSSNSSASYMGINYAWHARGGGYLSIYENDSRRGNNHGPYQVGDLLSVERIGQTVYYKQNGETVYISTLPSTGTLKAAAALFDVGEKLVDAVIVGAIVDADGDQIDDVWETANGLNPTDSTDALLNSDADSLTNLEEYQNNTNPMSWDSDADGMSDDWELSYGLNPLDASDASLDPDGDGIDSLTEYQQKSDPLHPAGIEQVIWTDLVGVTANANALSKTADSVWGNAGAASQQMILDDGAVEFTVTSMGDYPAFGLSNSNASASFDTIGYAWMIQSGGKAFTYENGVYTTGIVIVQIGDVLRVERIGTTVNYQHNGVTIYTSTEPSTGTLIADVAMLANGGQIVDALIYGAMADFDVDQIDDVWETAHGLNPNDATDAALDGDVDGLTNLQEFQLGTNPTSWDSDADGMADGWEVQYGLNPLDAADAGLNLDQDNFDNLTEYQQGSDPTVWPPGIDIVWTDLVGMAANGNTLTKTAATAWGNSDAVSQQMVRNNGAVEFTVSSTGDYPVFGLSNNNASASYDTIGYAWMMQSGGDAFVYENGVRRSLGYAQVQAGDVLRVERIGTAINYQHNGVTVYTSPESSTGTLIADVTIYVAGGQIADALIYGAMADADVDLIDDVWESAHGLSPNDAADAALDGDSDGLTNLEEFQLNTYPSNWDSDNDGIPDGWEVQYGLNPLDASDASLDTDADGIDNLTEYQQGSEPTFSLLGVDIVWIDLLGMTANGNSLTKTAASGWGNSDAISQQVIQQNGAVEFTVASTSHYSVLGLSNSSASASYDTIEYAWMIQMGDALTFENGGYAGGVVSVQIGDVLRIERVGTMISYQHNGVTVRTSSIPSTGTLIADASINHNGAQIVNALIHGVMADADVDQIDDVWEIANGLSPNDATDAALDGDSDGLTNLEEFQLNTNPTDWDSDADGMADGWEVQYGLNPLDASDASPDLDQDNIYNITEYQLGSDPTQPPPGVDIVWTDLVGMTATGNTLTKTADYGWNNSHAVSEQEIRKNGAVEFSFTSESANSAGYPNFSEFGLSSRNVAASYDTVEYGWRIEGSGKAVVYENGIRTNTSVTLRLGQTLHVERIGNTILYKHTGQMVYTSNDSPTGPLVANASMLLMGDQITNLVMHGAMADEDVDQINDVWEIFYGLNPNDDSDASLDSDIDGSTNLEEFQLNTNPNDWDSDDDGMADGWEVQYGLNPLDASDASLDPDVDGIDNLTEYQLGSEPVYVKVSVDVIWTDLLGVTANGNTLTKIASTAWGNAGAASQQQIIQNGGVEFSFIYTAGYSVLGLSNSNASANFDTIDYALRIESNDYFTVIENGVQKGTFGPAQIGDVLRVERIGTTVYYQHNSVTVYTSAEPSTGALIADTAIAYNGEQVVAAMIDGVQ